MLFGRESGRWLRWKRGQYWCMAWCMFSKKLCPTGGHTRAKAVGVKSQEVKEEGRGRQEEETLGYSLPSLPFGLRLWRCPSAEFSGLLCLRRSAMGR